MQLRTFTPAPGEPWLVTPESTPLPDGLTGLRRVTFRQQASIAVPSTLENIWRLREAGHRVPAPILHTYRFPEGTFASQRARAAFLTTNPRAFDLSEMGTGKTRTACFAMDWLFQQKIIRRALVVAPLSTVGAVWGAELFGRFGHLKTLLLVGHKRKKEYTAKPWQIGVTNYEGLAVLHRQIAEDKTIDLVIFDEVAIMRSCHRTMVGRAARFIASRATWVWGLTGSPTPNSPLDAWSQVALVVPQAVRRLSRKEWKMLVEVESPAGSGRFVPTPDARLHVTRLMRPAIRYTRESMFDLPPLTVVERECSMTPEQLKAYRQMKHKLIVEYAEGRITAANAGVKIIKLIQIAAGVVYDDARNEISIGFEHRCKVVEELISQATRKVLVLAPFRSVLRRLVDQIGKEHNVAHVDGSVGHRERSSIITNFQDKNHPLRILIAHPGTMAHGLTLTEADTIIWYSPILSRERFEQANARIRRLGQRHPQLQVRVIGAEVDRHVYRVLEDKLAFQDQCLKLFEMLREDHEQGP